VLDDIIAGHRNIAERATRLETKTYAGEDSFLPYLAKPRGVGEDGFHAEDDPSVTTVRKENVPEGIPLKGGIEADSLLVGVT
jgi:hypothetical protein